MSDIDDIDDVAFVNAQRIARLKPTFDARTHTWTLQDDHQRARVLIATDGAMPDGGDRDALGLEPYLGVAVHGLPNYFLITGPDVAAQKSYIAKCLQKMASSGATRIEVRYSAQRTFTERRRSGKSRPIQWRRVARYIRSSFDLSSPIAVADDLYDGPATVHIGDESHDTRVRLTGHFNPLDGQYHWQGTIFDQLSGTEKLPQPATVTIREQSAAARITERTSQGGYSVVGVGAPPFALDAAEVAVPVQ